MKPTRRTLIAGSTALAASLGAPRLRAEPVLTEDGFYKQPWFVESFLELADDLQAAAKSGKRFAIMWELRGCPYCRETHLVNFARPDIEDYIKSNFEILQLNITGSRKVTDFDGAEVSERRSPPDTACALHRRSSFSPVLPPVSPRNRRSSAKL